MIARCRKGAGLTEKRTMSEIEEVPPYEEWTVAELKAELKARGLNHAGVHKTLVARLYMDDESEVVEDPAPSEVQPRVEDPSTWVDGAFFFKSFDVDSDSRNVLGIPSDAEHDSFRQQAHALAVNAGYTPVGSWTNSGLLNSFIIPGFVRLAYKVPIKG